MIKDQSQRTLAKRHKREQLYALEEAKMEALATVKSPLTSSDLRHQRMKNPYSKNLQVFNRNEMLSISNWLNKHYICTSCQLGNHCKLQFHDFNKLCQFPLEKIHFDLWGANICFFY